MKQSVLNTALLYMILGKITDGVFGTIFLIIGLVYMVIWIMKGATNDTNK